MLSGRKVLIVDDEEMLRVVMEMIISENGGEAIVADGAESALSIVNEILANDDEDMAKVDVAVIDFSMPKVNGYELYERLLDVDPELRVVFISGLNAIMEIEKLVAVGRADFLKKPFSEEDLLSAIAKQLNCSSNNT